MQSREGTLARLQRTSIELNSTRIGGATSAILTSPLEVLKTRLQSDFYQSQIRKAHKVPAHSALSLHRGALLHVRETFQLLYAIPHTEGWRALFKGLGPTLTGVAPARAINFWAYGNGKRIIRDNLNQGREAAWVHMCAAANAGIITGTATNPIWVIKTRLQLDKNRAERTGSLSNRQYKNSLDCIKQTMRAEGVKGLYRGLSASYLGVTESTLQWVLFEQVKIYLRQREERIVASGRERTSWDNTVRWTGNFAGAGAAKFFAAIITYPHEVVRTRLRQAPQKDGRMKYTGIVQCFKTIWKEEGMVSLYGGLTPHILRTVPSSAIMFGM